MARKYHSTKEVYVNSKKQTNSKSTCNDLERMRPTRLANPHVLEKDDKELKKKRRYPVYQKKHLEQMDQNHYEEK
jgi:hypothetical protein